MTFELKPYHRVQMQNGREGIVVVNPHNDKRPFHTTAELLIILHAGKDYSNGYMPGQMSYDKLTAPLWDVVKVWDAPGFYGDLLDFDRKGKLLWQEESEAVLKATADIESAKRVLAEAEGRLKALLFPENE